MDVDFGWLLHIPNSQWLNYNEAREIAGSGCQAVGCATYQREKNLVPQK